MTLKNNDKEKNTPFIGNVAYSQREFSYDNYLMELVRHTIEFIKRKPYGNNLLIRVKDEVQLVVEATRDYEPYDRQKIIDENKKNTVRHAYFREYLALQRLCLLILQHQKHQIGSGSRQIYGIVFDGAWLWEEYVGSLIDEMFYHPMNKGGKGAQRLFDGNIGLIYPDFISRDTEARIIADAKYKPVDNIGNRDYLQVLAYMFRFDAKAGYYLYPDAVGIQIVGQLDGGLSAEGDHDAHGVFHLDDVHDVFRGQGLEIQTVRGVIVRGNGLGIVVDDNHVITDPAEGPYAVDRGVVELDALADTDGAGTQHDDHGAAGTLQAPGLAGLVRAGIEVGRFRGEFCAAGIHHLIAHGPAGNF